MKPVKWDAPNVGRALEETRKEMWPGPLWITVDVDHGRQSKHRLQRTHFAGSTCGSRVLLRRSYGLIDNAGQENDGQEPNIIFELFFVCVYFDFF